MRPVPDLAGYGDVPIAFEVRTELVGPALEERPIAVPWVKDYDAHEAPLAWPARFDTAGWGILAVLDAGERVGGAVLVAGDPRIELLGGRDDLAALWDLRVRPSHRGRGVGRALFGAAERWALERGCRALQVETQSINVPACRFYARRGCTLAAVHPGAYPDLPGEIQLLWRKELR